MVPLRFHDLTIALRMPRTPRVDNGIVKSRLGNFSMHSSAGEHFHSLLERIEYSATKSLGEIVVTQSLRTFLCAGKKSSDCKIVPIFRSFT